MQMAIRMLERMVHHMIEDAFANRPVTMNPKKNLLEIEEHMYILDDVEKPNVFRNMFPYSEIPKIPFNDRIVPHNMPKDIWITDTTFRDGQQSRAPYTTEQIVAIYDYLHKLGGPNGMIRASEQAVVVENSVYQKVKDEFTLRGCYFVEGKDRQKLANTIVQDNQLNPAIVGQSAVQIAQMAGIKVPPHTKILIAQAQEVNDKEVFAREKLSPVLAFYRAKDFNHAVKTARDLILYGGAGHTSVLYTDETNEDHIDRFQDMPTARTLINIPSSQGAIGDVYNFKLAPSLTLGCGSWGGNSVSENIGVKHLMNVKSVAQRRENMYWYKVPSKIYCKRGALQQGGIKQPFFACGECHQHHAASQRLCFCDFDTLPHFSGIANIINNIHSCHLIS